MQAKVMGMAMAEAGKLFDSQGGAASGTKEDAMSGAASTAMKLMMSVRICCEIPAMFR